MQTATTELGTPMYMSPELLQADPVNPDACDSYVSTTTQSTISDVLLGEETRLETLKNSVLEAFSCLSTLGTCL